MKLFNNDLNWYKGNLHCHTNISDGSVSPCECIDIYKNNGYDFLSITDHRKFFLGYQTKDFILFNGAEFHINDFRIRKAYHIVGIGTENDIYTDDHFEPQTIINEINRQNGIAIIAHPAWSLLTHSDLIDLHDYVGVEIWNTVSEVKVLRGDSSNYLDVVASKGVVKYIFAADDTHLYTKDLFGGYIMVNSKSLDRDSILKNIKAGNFYSSQGPEIKQITLEEDIITVECTPVRQIAFFSDTFYSAPDKICYKEGQLVDTAKYKVKETDTVVRIECIDENNKKAWSQFTKIK